MDNTATVKALHVDASEFEMPQDVKLAKIAQALAHEDVISAEHSETVYTVSGDNYGNEGFSLIRGQQHLGFLGALAFQKALLHQLFDGGGSRCRGADALTFYALRHTVCTGGFHRMK